MNMGNAMSAAIPATIPLRTESPITLDWPTSADAPTVTIDLDLPYTSAPQLGSLLRVDLGSDQFWLRVEDVRATDTDASPPFDGVRVSCSRMRFTAMNTLDAGKNSSVCVCGVTRL